MRERGPDHLALVLEGHDVLNGGLRRQCLPAIGPDVDDHADARRWQVGKRCEVVVRVDDDLAAARRRSYQVEARIRFLRRWRIRGDGNEVTFDPRTGSVNAAGVTLVDHAGGLLSVTCLASAAQCTAVDLSARQVTFDPDSGAVIGSAPVPAGPARR
jgi:hypothetical protein